MNLFDKFIKKETTTSTGTPVETWQAIASGTVQGVGFRWSVATLAQGMGITGTVKNNPDMTVTIILQANHGKVNEFLKELPNNVSPFAKITNIDVKRLENVEKMHDFHVIY
ncbi:acylphosphatase [Lactobacillus sp. LL6]|uniref:acylphosphatase n=1 Tax=Lactobacillus sp. LL6 TaxID=2596827 RepID=UPI001186A437|nr:acylphosphatase [Lactobacillus sp. LL6]TSO26581.1 acylphosphatase [Lactobacillus sp. LL6]